MIYLSGAVRAEYAAIVEETRRPFGALTHARRCELFELMQDVNGLGFLHTPNMGNRAVPRVVWAADNGCFTDPEGFSLDRYRRWLDTRDRASCLFVTCPDYVGDWSSTLDRFYATAPTLRADGWRVALVAQDGLEVYADRFDWRDCDALFIGGSTEWKISEDAAYCVAQAQAQGPTPWIHMGRVNGPRRMGIAERMGCDSADGTYLARAGASGHAEVMRWLTPTGQLDLLAA